MPRNLEVVARLRDAGVRMAAERPQRPAAPGALAGKTFVLTGTLSGLLARRGGRRPSRRSAAR